MQPLPIPPYREAVEPLLIPTILTIFKTIRHLYLPTCTTAPSYIQYIPRKAHPSLSQPWPNTTPIAHSQPTGSSGAIAHPQPRGDAVQPLPIPTYREAVKPLLIPTILTSYILVHKYIIQNHPPSLFTNMYHGTILHSIHTAQTPPFPIQTLAKQCSHSPSPTYGKQWSHCPSPLCTTNAAIAHPQPRGNLWTHCQSPLTLSNPKLQQWAIDPTWAPMGVQLAPPILGPWASDPKSKKMGGAIFEPPILGPPGVTCPFSIFGSLRVSRPPLHQPTPSYPSLTHPPPPNTIPTQTMKLKNEYNFYAAAAAAATPPLMIKTTSSTTTIKTDGA